MKLKALAAAVLFMIPSAASAELRQLADLPQSVTAQFSAFLAARCSYSGVLAPNTPIGITEVGSDNMADYVIRPPTSAAPLCPSGVNFLVLDSESNAVVAYEGLPESAEPQPEPSTTTAPDTPAADDNYVGTPEAGAVEVGPDGTGDQPSPPSAQPYSSSDDASALEPETHEPMSQSSGSKIGLVITAGLVGLGLLALGINMIARRTQEKYGYRVFLNWWNVLYVPIPILLIAGAVMAHGNTGDGVFLALAIPAAALLVWRVGVNIGKTSLVTGLLISIIQLLCFVIVVVAVLLRSLFKLDADERERRRSEVTAL